MIVASVIKMNAGGQFACLLYIYDTCVKVAGDIALV